MERPLVVVERDVDLPRTIVWDALVDADLVSGWLGEAVIVPEVGGEYNLTWPQRPDQPPTFGRIVALQHPELLIVDTNDLGMLEFGLDDLPGGTRGTATRVRVEVGLEDDAQPDDSGLLAARIADQWRTNLDQLEELLRGRPVDWRKLPGSDATPGS